MEDIRLKTIILGMVRTNCYIVSNTNTNQAIVIDPADNEAAIIGYLQDNSLELEAIMLTHGHFDHIMASSELARRTGATVYAHETESSLLKDPGLNASREIGSEISLTPDVLFRDGDEVLLAGFKIGVIHTPGHTAGSACYYFKDQGMLFSGDTLFNESVGRTDLPTGSSGSLIASIRNKLMVLNDDVKVYPGHGMSTTIGHERNFNYYIAQGL
jgi:glyoxylase-like metal-dependent hydrolase (beta-lactamase superfamily II)